MRPRVIAQFLMSYPGKVKEIVLLNGERYRVRSAEDWSIGPALNVSDRGDSVHIAFLSVANIRIIGGEGQL